MSTDSDHQGQGETPELNTLVLCDLVDSTALLEKLGDQRAAQLIRKHDRMARAVLELHQGREIDKTDGFLLLFTRPIYALGFALDYLRGLAHLSAAESVLLRARVGVHMGEVLIWKNPAEDIRRGAKPIEVEGLAKPIAARLAQLGLPGQILLSSAAAGLARRAEIELQAGGEKRELSWKHHGYYRLKGVPEPIEVLEVGELRSAPLRPPPSTRNARRLLPWWRRPLILTAETVVLLVAVGMGMWFGLRSPPALAFAARDWVVVTGVQNYSGIKTLNDALATAVRIGLSQSRYVNVMPDMEVAATLRRMRLPADTPVTRQLGIQIAQRQGARAVIVPVLNSVGGQLQVAAEVVDPKNGAVVYTDSAVASNARGLLPTTDKVLREIRSNLGESMVAIGKSSAPLAEITTSNLGALRAYSKALQLLGGGKVKQALLLLNEAIQQDPKFALAHSKRAAIELAFLGDRAAAYRDLQAALRTSSRLSLRERLGVQGMFNMVFGQLDKAIDKYSLLSSLYPGAVGPQQDLGEIALWYSNRLAQAAKHFRVVTRSHDPQRGGAWFGLALAETGMGHRNAAVHAVQQGWKLGTIAPRMQDLPPLLVTGDYAVALKRLNSMPKTLPPAIFAAIASNRAALALIQGEDQAASADLLQALDLAHKGGDESQQAIIKLAQRAWSLYARQPGARTALRRYAQQLTSSFGQDPVLITGNRVLVAARVAMLARTYHLRGLAERLLQVSRASAFRGGYPSREAFWNTASCYTRRGLSDTQRIACLKALLNGHEYAETHIALMNLYRRSGQSLPARDEALWLQKHRGQALVELHNQPMLIPNILALRIATNIAKRGGAFTAKQHAKPLLVTPLTSP